MIEFHGNFYSSLNDTYVSYRFDYWMFNLKANYIVSHFLLSSLHSSLSASNIFLSRLSQMVKTYKYSWCFTPRPKQANFIIKRARILNTITKDHHSIDFCTHRTFIYWLRSKFRLLRWLTILLGLYVRMALKHHICRTDEINYTPKPFDTDHQ